MFARMSLFFIVLGAVWGVSGVAVVLMFALDERAHRRSLIASSPASSTTAPTARPRRTAHVDGALI